MLNISPMASFIEFVGAFNFANVYESFQERFFKYILDVDKRFEESFHELEASIASMKEAKFEVLKLSDGRSNESAANNLQDECNRLILEEESIRKNTSNIVYNDYKTQFSRPMFIFCGLYSTFLLLSIGLMDMNNDKSIYSSVALYNILSWMVIIYFVVCEIAKHFFSNKFLSPSRWGTIKMSLVLPIIPFINWLIVENIGIFFEMSQFIMDIMVISGIALTFMGFMITIIATGIYYKLSSTLIIKETTYLMKKYRALDKKKRNLDELAEMFTSEMEFD